jgi:hypothetical protein
MRVNPCSVDFYFFVNDPPPPPPHLFGGFDKCFSTLSILQFFFRRCFACTGLLPEKTLKFKMFLLLSQATFFTAGGTGVFFS